MREMEIMHFEAKMTTAGPVIIKAMYRNAFVYGFVIFRRAIGSWTGDIATPPVRLSVHLSVCQSLLVFTL